MSKDNLRHADVLANDPCTREFLQAGERLLHDILARDAEETPGREFVDRARAELSATDLAEASANGSSLTIEEALDLARGD